MTSYVCAVDVGTRSARAGVFSPDGTMVAKKVEPFAVYEASDHFAEYSSAEIWEAVARAVSQVIDISNLPPTAIKGLAFDATCSLVLRQSNGTGVPLGPDGRDTIAWYDHRAVGEACICTETDHPLIGHLGGTMPAEMQTPKLMWLKRHRPELWASLGRARDLSDDLTARATGQTVCSSNTLVAKWAYLPRSGGWQHDFLAKVGLEDLLDKAALPSAPQPVGSQAGTLTATAATELGLCERTPVAVGLIDAYAGALGALAKDDVQDTGSQLSLVTGTSTCVLALSRQSHRATGLWGPFHGAIFPDRSCCEGGLSAAGALLDHVIASWPGQSGKELPTHKAVIARIRQLVERDGATLAEHLHLLPDFNGNRTPFADPTLTGTIVGLSLDRSFDALCGLYWRAAVALALGTRQIVEHMADAGMKAPLLTVTGGFSRSPLLLQLHADAIGMNVRIPHSHDGVLLGTARAASVAAGLHRDLNHAAAEMSPDATILTPNPANKVMFDRQFEIFKFLQRQRAELAELAEVQSQVHHSQPSQNTV